MPPQQQKGMSSDRQESNSCNHSGRGYMGRRSQLHFRLDRKMKINKAMHEVLQWLFILWALYTMLIMFGMERMTGWIAYVHWANLVIFMLAMIPIRTWLETRYVELYGETMEESVAKLKAEHATMRRRNR